MTRRKDNGANPSRSYTRYVPCQVEPGMFREEWLVFLTVMDPVNPNRKIRVQALVDVREVMNLQGSPRRNRPAEGWLRVALAGKEKGFARVVLPQPASPLGEDVLVEDNLVKEAPGA